MMWKQAVAEERRLTLPEMLEFGENANRHTVLLHAMFLQKELPVRLAKRIHDLRSLPKPMWSTRAVSSLISLYEESFVRIVDHEPPRNSVAETAFSETLADILDRHRTVKANIAAGFAEMDQSGVRICSVESSEIQEVLTRFYRGRIGIRLLMKQHLSLRKDVDARARRRQKGMSTTAQDFVGCVKTRCRIKEVLETATADAQSACALHLNCAPRVVINDNRKLTAAYIPEHLYVVLFEVLKNAMRATAERHRLQLESERGPRKGAPTLPPIVATISGDGDCEVRISDQGGGIPPESLGRIWLFSFSSAAGGMASLAGYGYGLPLSRLYARCWGGDLTVNNRPGQGVDCVVRLGVPPCSGAKPDRDHSRGKVPAWVAATTPATKLTVAV